MLHQLQKVKQNQTDMHCYLFKNYIKTITFTYLCDNAKGPLYYNIISTAVDE